MCARMNEHVCVCVCVASVCDFQLKADACIHNDLFKNLNKSKIIETKIELIRCGTERLKTMLESPVAALLTCVNTSY